MKNRSNAQGGFKNPQDKDNVRTRREAMATIEEREWRDFWGGATYRATYGRHAYVRYCTEEVAR